jgi:hypothetical protein
LTGFNDWNALKYIVPQQALAAQAFEVPKEENISAVDQSRLILLEGIDNAIQRLINQSEPNTIMHKPKGMFDTTHIAQLLKTDQLEAAITELNKLQAKVVAVFGQEAANREVVPQIQNLISSLKQEEPSSTSTPPPLPPPPSHHDRIKDRIDEALDRHIAVGGAHGEAAQKIKDRLNGSGDGGHHHHLSPLG